MDTRAEHNAFHYASDAELDRAGAYQEGANRTDQAWILSDRDVWYKNPYYRGPAVPHPDDECYADASEGEYPFDEEKVYNAPDYDEPEDNIPF